MIVLMIFVIVIITLGNLEPETDIMEHCLPELPLILRTAQVKVHRLRWECLCSHKATVDLHTHPITRQFFFDIFG